MEQKKLSKKAAKELLASKGVLNDKANIICIADGIVTINVNSPLVNHDEKKETVSIDIITDDDIHIDFSLEKIIDLNSKYLSITVSDDEGYVFPGQNYLIE